MKLHYPRENNNKETRYAAIVCDRNVLALDDRDNGKSDRGDGKRSARYTRDPSLVTCKRCASRMRTMGLVESNERSSLRELVDALIMYDKKNAGMVRIDQIQEYHRIVKKAIEIKERYKL